MLRNITIASIPEGAQTLTYDIARDVTKVNKFETNRLNANGLIFFHFNLEQSIHI